MKSLFSMVFLSVFVFSIVLFPNETEAGDFAAFSFVVFGDNRLPGYFPFSENQIEEIEQCFEQIMLYAYGPDAQLDHELSFDPITGELDWFRVWPVSTPDAYSLSVLKNGWPRLMVRGPGANIVLRSEGQAWVYNSIIEDIREGEDDPLLGPSFCLNTGDMTYFGFFGTSRDDSPFWSDLYERFLAKLPESNPEGLPGRFFPAPGNHETWLDEDLDGLLSTVPYLSEMGFTIENRVYMFDYEGCRFIFLDTGDMDYRNPSEWGGRYPEFQVQMDNLTDWLQEAVDIGSRQVFITFHNPAFCQSGFGPLPEEHNPHYYIEPFASDLSITVFNGHVHTTEVYEVEGIRYLVLGGGGGEQSHETTPQSDDYPEEMYWKGNQRVEDYNYLLVQVSGDWLSMQLHRYRPEAETPYESIELYR
ncbi:MAG: metallophosphoesterase [Candidatus Aegiribacteria sp.]|nr:metallophosphoesterase [Candidatus Aegiribacteria sp.]